jgi:hypothetical protein
MAEGIDASSFEFYEGIRILVPGAITLGLAEGVVRTVSSDGAGLGLSTFESFVASLLIGLVFYFVDAPAKAAVAVPLRPTDTLFSWNVTPRKGTNTVNNYFVMLDQDIPGPIRARALYMGSMYRIGFEAVYLLALVSAALLSLGNWTSRSLPVAVHREPREVWLGAAALVFVWLYSLYLDRAERKKKKKPTDVRSKHFSWWDLLFMVVVVAIHVVLFLKHDDIPGWLLVVPSAVLFGIWAVRYFRGYSKRANGRSVTRPISAAHACLLLLVAQLSVLSTLVLRPFADAELSHVELRAWLMGAVAALVLVCARGHERRLRGAYVTQSTWLDLHKSEIIVSYFTEPPAPTPPSRQGERPGSAAPEPKGFRARRKKAWD